MAKRFEPKILAFLCKWCSYAAADLAGVSRCQYPPSIRTILSMCSGRVDPVYVIEGLRRALTGSSSSADASAIAITWTVMSTPPNAWGPWPTCWS
jgi:F420-non-reducing hydrogenase iron-sulfur subunit